ILRRARERTDVIEAGRERIRSPPAHATVGRLDADAAARGARGADRAAGVGPGRDRNQPGAGGRARSAARAARYVSVAPRVVRRAEVRVVGRRAQGDLVRVRLADDDGSGREQATNGLRVLGRDVIAEEPRAIRRADAGGVGQVLDADRDAVQRPAVGAARELLAELVGTA